MMNDITPVPQFCRECRDELPYGSKLPEADFILWGKYFPPEAFGPKCYFHASQWIKIELVDQYAVYDLRPANKLISQLEDTSHTIKFEEGGRFTIQHPLKERLDGSLMECEVHEYAETHWWPGRPGTYQFDRDPADGSPVLTQVEE